MKSSAKNPTPKKKGYIFIGSQDDFVPGKPITVRLMGKPVSVFGGDDGFFAREMGCKHQGADLSAFPIANGKVTCARHGWRYDLVSGHCENHDSPPLRTHHVVLEGDAVFVALFPGDPPPEDDF